jgi:hypothetical protein
VVAAAAAAEAEEEEEEEACEPNLTGQAGYIYSPG